MKEPWIELKNVSFQYRGVDELALKNINLTIRRGEKVLVLGANESGKSTFIKLLMNQITEQGSVFGEIIRHEEETTVVDATHLEHFLSDETSRIAQTQVLDQQINEVYQTDLSEESFNLLSPGEQAIFRFLKSLHTTQNVFLFDEPLKNVSPHMGEVIVDTIDDLHQKLKATVIISEHHLEEMMYRPIDRVFVMSDGRVVFDGALEALLRQNLLASLGIREPLYITAMRYAGYPTDQVVNIAKVNHLFGPKLRQTIQSWINTVPSFIYPKPGEVILEAKDVAYAYANDRTRGVKKTNLTIRQGEMISVCGDNGSGKTTLGRLLSGAVLPSEGEIVWQGEAITAQNVDRFKREVPFIRHRRTRMTITESVHDYLMGVIHHYHYTQTDSEHAIDQALKQVDLFDKMDQIVANLSFVEQRRLALAGALVRDPKLVIIEAPTEGQDFEHFRAIMNYIYSLNADLGLTIMITTHDIETMLEYTRRTFVMARGHIIADETPVKVITSPYLVKQSALRTTSLNAFAQRIDLMDPYTFIQKFMDYDREVQRLTW
ncbi:MAG: DUF3744 domain-containing protein [Aerococcus sp.]|nr:DUF3744 domain-containing protein [Aerococcus sp.]